MKASLLKTFFLTWLLVEALGASEKEIAFAQIFTKDAVYVSSHGNSSGSIDVSRKRSNNTVTEKPIGESITVGNDTPRNLTCTLPNSPVCSEGVLRVHAMNPLYFTDDSGKPIYLSGHQIFVDLQDNAFDIELTYNHQRKLDFSWYMHFMKARNLNYIRNWTEFSTGSGMNGGVVSSPMPFKRVSGQGNANDGGLKFDVNQFDDSFFDLMRSRIIDAGKNGIVVSIMLFDVYAFSNFDDTLWQGNVFNRNNNINGIDADANNDDWGYEFFHNPSKQLLAIQQSYVKKVVDTVNDLDNVIYEIANELGNAEWQYDMINLIKNYESSKPKQHLIYLSPGGVMTTNSYTDIPQNTIINSPAHLFSVSGQWADYINDPPLNEHGKPGIIDMDHVFWRNQPMSTNMQVPWKAFTRGYHFNFYDDPFAVPENETAEWEMLRKAAGSTVTYVDKVLDLAKMLPSTTISSTQFALANPGSEYLVYSPNGGSFTVNLAAGTYNYEWFSPASAAIISTGSMTAAGGNQLFTTPSSGDAVLYLRNAR